MVVSSPFPLITLSHKARLCAEQRGRGQDVSGRKVSDEKLRLCCFDTVVFGGTKRHRIPALHGEDKIEC